jgi:hypothetical protein
MSKQSDLISVSQGAAGDPLFVDAANNRVGIGTTAAPSSSDVKQVISSSNGAFTQYSYNGGAGGVVGSADVGYLDFFTYTGNIGSETYTRRMTIDASGDLLVGTTSSTGAKFNVQASGEVASFNDLSGTGIFRFRSSGSTIGYIQWAGSTTSYVTSSDYRLKENIVPLAGAADRLAQIPVHQFNFIADPDKTVDGFLAHEVQAFVPECVTGEKDQVETVEVTDEDGNVTTETRPVYQGIDQSKLVPLLTAALQEALQKIDALETRISALETN